MWHTHTHTHTQTHTHTHTHTHQKNNLPSIWVPFINPICMVAKDQEVYRKYFLNRYNSMEIESVREYC